MEWISKNLGLIVGIGLSLGNIMVWLNKAYKLKKNNEVFHGIVDKHENQIKELENKFIGVIDKLDNLFEINKIQTRYIIVSACTDAIEKGSIDQYQLQSLEDMYSMYTEILNGNSYTSTLMYRVRKLKINVDSNN